MSLKEYQDQLVAVLGPELDVLPWYGRVGDHEEIKELVRRIRGTIAFAQEDDLAFCVLFSCDYLPHMVAWLEAWTQGESTKEHFDVLAQIIVSR